MYKETTTLLSPHLFNIYINDLLAEVNQETTTLIAYADDLLLFAHTVEGAQRRLNHVNTWAAEHSLAISTTKTYILGSTTPIFHANGSEVAAVESTPYLGIPLTAGGLDWRTYYSATIRACRRQLYHIDYITRSWPLTARVDIYTTFLLPKLEYGGSLFVLHTSTFDFHTVKLTPSPAHQHTWHNLEQFQKEAAKIILKQHAFTGPLFNVLN